MQAYVQLVNMEREKAEKERKKEEEERRRKREEQQRKKRILEAAFDGDIEEINKILQEVCTYVQMSARTYVVCLGLYYIIYLYYGTSTLHIFTYLEHDILHATSKCILAFSATY